MYTTARQFKNAINDNEKNSSQTRQSYKQVYLYIVNKSFAYEIYSFCVQNHKNLLFYGIMAIGDIS